MTAVRQPHPLAYLIEAHVEAMRAAPPRTSWPTAEPSRPGTGAGEQTRDRRSPRMPEITESELRAMWGDR